jgi:hypothetical protein
MDAREVETFCEWTWTFGFFAHELIGVHGHAGGKLLVSALFCDNLEDASDSDSIAWIRFRFSGNSGRCPSLCARGKGSLLSGRATGGNELHEQIPGLPVVSQ